MWEPDPKIFKIWNSSRITYLQYYTIQIITLSHLLYNQTTKTTDFSIEKKCSSNRSYS